MNRKHKQRLLMARLANHRRSPTAKGIGAKGIGRFRDPQNPDEASPFGGGGDCDPNCQIDVATIDEDDLPRPSWWPRPFPGVTVEFFPGPRADGECDPDNHCAPVRGCSSDYSFRVTNESTSFVDVEFDKHSGHREVVALEPGGSQTFTENTALEFICGSLADASLWLTQGGQERNVYLWCSFCREVWDDSYNVIVDDSLNRKHKQRLLMARLASHRRSPTAKGIGAKAIGRFRDPDNPDEASPLGGGTGGNFCVGCVIDFHSSETYPWFPFPGVRVTLETPDESQGDCDPLNDCAPIKNCRPKYTVVVENTGNQPVEVSFPVLVPPVKGTVNGGGSIRRFNIDETNPSDGIELDAECGWLLAGHTLEIKQGGKVNATLMWCTECEIEL